VSDNPELLAILLSNNTEIGRLPLLMPPIIEDNDTYLSFYPTAEILNYQVSRKDDLLSSLLLMKQDDHEFSQLLVSDDYVRKLFTMQLEHRIHKTSKKKLPVRIGTVLIMRSLKIRTRFAIRQKERLKDHVHDLHPPALRSHVIHEVNSDMERVLDLIVHFTEYDQDLQQMGDEAGRWVNDTLDVSYPALIADDAA
jgi:hypothetical protein